MILSGRVTRAAADDTGCGWVDLDLAVCVSGTVKTSCRARVAIPCDGDDNPWERKDEHWKPGMPAPDGCTRLSEGRQPWI